MKADADELIRQVEDCADEIERQGRIPEALATSMRGANCFSLLLPAEYGGRQMAFPEYLRRVQAFGRADGSTGWCVNQASVLSTLARQMTPQAAAEIWQDAGCSIANGPPSGACRAVRAGDDFELTGHWTFSSGILQAQYLGGVAPLEDSGVHWFFFPRSAATIQERWPVRGLRGTASYEFSVERLRVPGHMAMRHGLARSGPALYRLPLNLMFAGGFAAVALGVSRGALDFAVDRVRQKVKRFDRNKLSSNESVQAQVGRAEALWRSAERFLHGNVADVWAEIADGAPLSDEHRIALRMAGTHVIRQAKDVTDIAYALCSTDSIFTENDIQRRFQDMHVITQHLQGRTEVYALLGRYFLGEAFDNHLM